MIKPDGSGFREVTSGANNNGFPSFAPDGKRFVYRTAGPEGQGLRIMDLETNKVTTFTTEYDNFPLWSPRGDLIAFVRQYHGDYEIFTIHPDGREHQRVTLLSPGNDAHGSWSPDGEWIVFSSTRMGFKDEALYTDAPQPYGELFVMRYDGTHVQQLTDNRWEDGGATWQPTTKAGASPRSIAPRQPLASLAWSRGEPQITFLCISSRSAVRAPGLLCAEVGRTHIGSRCGGIPCGRIRRSPMHGRIV